MLAFTAANKSPMSPPNGINIAALPSTKYFSRVDNLICSGFADEKVAHAQARGLREAFRAQAVHKQPTSPTMETFKTPV